MAKRQPHLRRLSAAPGSLLAAELSGHVSHDGLILAATSNARADACVVDPSLSVCLLPSWDCLPFDRVSPSRAVMGTRMTSLHRVRDGGRRLVICPGRDTGATRRLRPRTPGIDGLAAGRPAAAAPAQPHCRRTPARRRSAVAHGARARAHRTRPNV